jgi:Uma2 family endonuclease
MVAVEKLYTVEEFEAFIARPENDDRRFELIHGEIVEKPLTTLRGWIVLLAGQAIMNYLDTHPIGWALVSADYTTPNDGKNYRIPDLSFITTDKGPLTNESPTPFMPDLAIEVQSPNQSQRLLRDKAAYYLLNGTHLVWIIYTDNPRVEVLKPGQPTRTLGMDDMLEGEDILPGFEIAVKAPFAKKAGAN